MEMLNRAIDGAALFKDMMHKIEAGAASAVPVAPEVAAWNGRGGSKEGREAGPQDEGARTCEGKPAMSASLNLSLRMQDIAKSLAEMLEEAAGEPIAFVLVLSADKIAQYVSNASRTDGTELIESLLARWKAGRADIPAHYNPDLPPLTNAPTDD
jgi:hypothetical protein